jgi:hypothetical protein
MSLHEQERIMYLLPARLQKLHNYTQDEMLDMFAKCEKNAKGDMVFQSFAEYVCPCLGFLCLNLFVCLLVCLLVLFIFTSV